MTARTFYGETIYDRFDALKKEKLEKAFHFLEMAIRAEEKCEENKERMAFKSALRFEAEAFV